VSLVPVSGPLVRGIYAACQLVLPAGWSSARIDQLYQETYAGSFFVRPRSEPPALNQVTGSNFCDLHLTVEDGVLSVISAIDNLVKGASGQAIQNLNVMLGIEEEAGLTQAPAYP
jgi:N-acetyl-gamma-glutamyl-phosphate reductase